MSAGAMVPDDATDCIWSSMNSRTGPEPLLAILFRLCMLLVTGARGPTTAATAVTVVTVLETTSMVLPNSLGMSFCVVLAGGGCGGARGPCGGNISGKPPSETLTLEGGRAFRGGGGARAAIGAPCCAGGESALGGAWPGGMTGTAEVGGSDCPGGSN